MAEVKSGSFATSGYSDPGWPDHYVFSWSLASQSIVDNTSTISWSLVGAGADTSGRYTGVKEKYVTVNGTTQSDSTLVYTYNGTVAFKGTTVIKHNSEGKASFSASAGGAFYYYGSYNSTGSGSWTLPTIARATTPSLSATSVTMGGSITITLTPAVSSFKHKLRYSFGSLSQQVSGFSEGNDFTPSGNRTVTFTPPTSLANQIPNATSGVCSILCYTYNSSGTHIGTVTKTITLNVPSYEPQITAITLTGSNLLSGEYVQGKSAVTINITASSSYGASIKSYSTTFDGKTYTGNSFKTSTLSAPGGSMSRAAMVTVTDTRGKTKILSSSSITVHPYSIPSITGFTLTRQSNGTTVVAVVNGAISSVNSKNAKTVSVVLNGVTQSATPTSYSISQTLTFTNVPTDSTLTGTATITDSYTKSTLDVVLPTVAVTMDFYKDGKGVAFGKVAETTDLLDVAWSERVRKNLTVDGNTTLNKAATISDTDWKTLILKRLNAIGAVTIQFQNNTGSLGFIGMTGEELNTPLRRWTSDGATAYTVLDTGFTKDHVVEQGTSGIWTYRKWNSGLAECFGSHPVTSMAVSTAWGALYCSARITMPSFPFTFKAVPQVNLSWNGTYTALIDGALGVTTTACGYTFILRADSSTLSGSVAIQAIGKWK